MIVLVREVAHRCGRALLESRKGSGEGIADRRLDVQCVVPHRGLDKAAAHGRRDRG